MEHLHLSSLIFLAVLADPKKYHANQVCNPMLFQCKPSSFQKVLNLQLRLYFLKCNLAWYFIFPEFQLRFNAILSKIFCKVLLAHLWVFKNTTVEFTVFLVQSFFLFFLKNELSYIDRWQKFEQDYILCHVSLYQLFQVRHRMVIVNYL